MRFIYTIFIHLYSAVIQLASPFSRKADLWTKGRRDIFKEINEKLRSDLAGNEKVTWFHCASLGEFEQGRPLMEKLKEDSLKLHAALGKPLDDKILLTFFSPSGYEIQKDYKGADFVFYLPADTPFNAKRFVGLLPLKAAFFIKYEFWFNYLIELKNKKVPTFLVSGIFRADQYFFKSYGSWARKQLHCFTHFFLQDVDSQKLLNQFGFTNTTISGDTRFDRVFKIAQNKKEFPLVKLFAASSRVMIAGSTWEEDEKIISSLKFENFIQTGLFDEKHSLANARKGTKLKMIIAPHEIHEEHIRSIIKLFEGQKTLRYSQATEENTKDARVLIIDNIGMLSSVYQYGDFAYIGGGFGEGIHNILEAAAFGLPTVFGPNFSKSIEATELITMGGAFTINTGTELANICNELLGTPENLQKTNRININYILQKKGATEIITNNIT